MVREDMAEEMEDNDRDEGKMIYRKDQTISQGFKRQFFCVCSTYIYGVGVDFSSAFSEAEVSSGNLS
ncbi:hypothetical protein KUTeg_015986 [Tegillarca granosa]|uniref:Uncharacterized protein n=1 Tax=Tegillarca granosa TaxID=220873 RepID=A0ABQ9ENG3_TEGGR|nr:hypothetical protein KUTeg_015986 [Tegillarca granosa]